MDEKTARAVRQMGHWMALGGLRVARGMGRGDAFVRNAEGDVFGLSLLEARFVALVAALECA